MKKLSLALFVSLLALSSTSFAQSKSKTPEPTSEITESTDPARAEEVLRRAAEIQARQQASADMSSGESGTKSKKSSGKQDHSKAKKSSKGASGGDASSGASSGSDTSSGSGKGGDNGSGK